MRSALCSVLSVSSAAGQADLVVTIVPEGRTDVWSVVAEFVGDLPDGLSLTDPAFTSDGAIWSDTWFELSGDSDITITNWNPAYGPHAIIGPPIITGNGSPNVEFIGLQPAFPLGFPDPSNPLRVADFHFEGDPRSIDMRFIGQNSILLVGNPAEPFGTILLYQDAAGNPGPLSIAFQPIPAPASLAFAPLALVAARRRRK